MSRVHQQFQSTDASTTISIYRHKFPIYRRFKVIFNLPSLQFQSTVAIFKQHYFQSTVAIFNLPLHISIYRRNFQSTVASRVFSIYRRKFPTYRRVKIRLHFQSTVASRLVSIYRRKLSIYRRFKIIFNLPSQIAAR